MKTITMYMKYSLIVLFLMTFAFNGFSKKWVVTVMNFQFTPSSLPNVITGDTIHWDWVNGTHTTTSTSVPAGALSWDQPIDNTHLTYEYVTTMAGTYNYHCMHHPSSMIASFTVTNGTAGIGATRIDPLVVYPNPTSGSITADIPGGYSNKMDDVTIIDLFGRTIFENIVNSGQQLSIDLSSYPSGYYVMRVITEEGILTKNIILDR